MAGRYTARLKLVPGGVGGTVELDGEPLRGVQSVNLQQGIHDLAVLTVGVRLFETEVESVGTVVQVPEETAATLARLGWTPPTGQPLPAVVVDDLDYDGYRSDGD